MQKKLMSLQDSPFVKVTLTHAGNVFTVVEAVFNDGVRVVKGEGMARRCSRDKMDDDLGQDIAVGRALRALEENMNGKGFRRHMRRFVDLMRG
jgi:hypothetical protein